MKQNTPYPSRIILLSLLFFLALPLPIHGQNKSPFQVDLAIDIPIIIGTGAIGLVPELIKDELHTGSDDNYDRKTVNPFDRPVTYYNCSGSKLASDIMIYSIVALPFVIDFLDVAVDKSSDRYLGFGKDALILAETLSINFIVNQVFKYSVRRPRPYLYNPNIPVSKKGGTDAHLSFYSMHTSTAFSIATAYAYLFMKRHPKSPWRYVVWVGGMSMASTVGMLRVFAGKHYWSDVITGAVVGGCIGFLVPYLHTIGGKSDEKSLQWHIQPVIGENGYQGIWIAFGF